jgi:hypothetical protein
VLSFRSLQAGGETGCCADLPLSQAESIDINISDAVQGIWEAHMYLACTSFQRERGVERSSRWPAMQGLFEPSKTNERLLKRGETSPDG